jgi:acid stress-induced BolA-like protein IbaG/YrbA
MKETILIVTQTFQSKNQEQRKQLVQEKIEQYLKNKLENL